MMRVLREMTFQRGARSKIEEILLLHQCLFLICVHASLCFYAQLVHSSQTIGCIR